MVPIQVGSQCEEIQSIESVNTGGGCMVDLVVLKSGKVLGITDDCVVLYTSTDAFYAATNEEDFKPFISLAP